MPFPTDEVLMKTAGDLVAQLQAIFGKHPGSRPAHAKGLLLGGTFIAFPEAATLSKATHFNSASTPIIVRFSDSTGLPQIPDSDPNAHPHGLGIRFILPHSPDGKRQHTDIIAHSTPFFPTRTGAEFLEVLQNIAGGTIGGFLETHPKALAFVQAPKLAPYSFAKEEYWGVNAFKFVNKEGKETFVRYHIVPVAGVEHYSDEEVKAKDPNYLQIEIAGRLGKGEEVEFKLLVQVAEEGDVTDDATIHWPNDRKVVELGVLKVKSVLEDNEKEQKHIIYDPIPRVEGIEPSADPLLEMRAAIYLLSGKERRAA